eukprot:jgi/Mesvir1/22534/Mv18553-RA.3
MNSACFPAQYQSCCRSMHCLGVGTCVNSCPRVPENLVHRCSSRGITKAAVGPTPPKEARKPRCRDNGVSMDSVPRQVQLHVLQLSLAAALSITAVDSAISSTYPTVDPALSRPGVTTQIREARQEPAASSDSRAPGVFTLPTPDAFPAHSAAAGSSSTLSDSRSEHGKETEFSIPWSREYLPWTGTNLYEGRLDGIELPPLPSTAPPLPALALPRYEKTVLANGLSLYLLEDHELGLVSGRLVLKGGSLRETVDKTGLASVTATVQRGGGTTKHPAEQLNAILENLSAGIETFSKTSVSGVGFSCLSEDTAKVYKLFTEVTLEPKWDPAFLTLVKKQISAALVRQNDEASSIATRELLKLVYGAESPYARYPTLASVQAITLDDLKEFHRATFSPAGAALAIWGDFDAGEMRRMVEESPLARDRWQKDDAAVARARKRWPLTLQSANPSLGTPIQEGEGVGGGQAEAGGPSRVYLVDKLGLTEGYVAMGELGTQLQDPDTVPLDVLNGILNGFGGRLFDQVRSRQGLGYTVYGRWSPGIEHVVRVLAHKDLRFCCGRGCIICCMRMNHVFLTTPMVVMERSTSATTGYGGCGCWCLLLTLFVIRDAAVFITSLVVGALSFPRHPSPLLIV